MRSYTVIKNFDFDNEGVLSQYYENGHADK